MSWSGIIRFKMSHQRKSILKHLKEEGKLEIVEPSENICEAYLEKSSNCLKSAKILLENDLYENSVGMSYYAMYNVLLALLSRTGIKCENHTASIILLDILFQRKELSRTMFEAKKERIDRQYYVADDNLAERSAWELLNNAKEFILDVKLIIENLTSEDINGARKKLRALISL